MNHVIAGKQLLMRRAAGADSKAETGIAMDKLCIEHVESFAFLCHIRCMEKYEKNGYDSNAS